MKSNEKKARRKFTSEFKSQAVKRVLSGHKVSAVAKELGISASLLHTWVTPHRASSLHRVSQATDVMIESVRRYAIEEKW
jgi:transposase-like protein